MTIEISKALVDNKAAFLAYFRQRGQETLEQAMREYAESQYKKRASAINRAATETRDALIKTLQQVAKRESWSEEEILRCILMATYGSYVVMLELRNKVWPYEYMAFSRRIGEIWEPFCKLCFTHSLRNLSLFVPPLFADVQAALTSEIDTYIDALNISGDEKTELKAYYAKVWSLVTSGEVKLELDLHFLSEEQSINIDFKSGFSSNEKGNTNRLLLVATIYKNLSTKHRCLLLVRSEEFENNHYLQTLKSSGVWEIYCGEHAYDQIASFTGFDLKKWIAANILWEDDFEKDTHSFMVSENLTQYLKW